MNRRRCSALVLLAVTSWNALAKTVPATTTQFAYDANGNLTRITDARLQVTTQSYDALNRLTSQQQPAAAAATSCLHHCRGQRKAGAAPARRRAQGASTTHRAAAAPLCADASVVPGA